jgi:hypothetical protein
VVSGLALVDGGLVTRQKFLEPATLTTDLSLFHEVVGWRQFLLEKKEGATTFGLTTLSMKTRSS